MLGLRQSPGFSDWKLVVMPAIIHKSWPLLHDGEAGRVRRVTFRNLGR